MNDTQLKFPEDDASAVSDLFGEYGYETKVLLGADAKKSAIEEALKEAQSKSDSDGALLIGLFGHGVQYADDAYFGPYDTLIRVVKDADGKTIRLPNGQPQLEPDPKSMISMKLILETLAISAAGNKILLADCCREDPSAARGRAFGTNLESAALPPGTAVFFSCSKGERAYEHDEWGHGAFTKAFLDETRSQVEQKKLRTNSLSGAIYDRVETMVRSKAGTHQRIHYRTNGTVVDLKLIEDIGVYKYSKAFSQYRNLKGSLMQKYKNAEGDAKQQILDQEKQNKETLLTAMNTVISNYPNSPGAAYAYTLAASSEKLNAKFEDLVTNPGMTGFAVKGTLEQLQQLIDRSPYDHVVALASLVQAKRQLVEDTGRFYSMADREQFQQQLKEFRNRFGRIKLPELPPPLDSGIELPDLSDWEFDKLASTELALLGKNLQHVKGKDSSGVEFSLKDYQGKIILVDFWADW